MSKVYVVSIQLSTQQALNKLDNDSDSFKDRSTSREMLEIESKMGSYGFSLIFSTGVLEYGAGIDKTINKTE